MGIYDRIEAKCWREVRLQRFCWSGHIQAVWWYPPGWWNRSRRCAHMYLNTKNPTVKSHCESMNILRMSTGWSSLAFEQKKKSVSLSYSWTLKNISTFMQLLEIFSACAWPSFSVHPGNYGNTEDWWSCWREQWHGYAPDQQTRRAFPVHAENSDSVQVFGEQMSIMNHMITLPYFSGLCSLT